MSEGWVQKDKLLLRISCEAHGKAIQGRGLCQSHGSSLREQTLPAEGRRDWSEGPVTSSVYDPLKRRWKLKECVSLLSRVLALFFNGPHAEDFGEFSCLSFLWRAALAGFPRTKHTRAVPLLWVVRGKQLCGRCTEFNVRRGTRISLRRGFLCDAVSFGFIYFISFQSLFIIAAIGSDPL